LYNNNNNEEEEEVKKKKKKTPTSFSKDWDAEALVREENRD